MRKSLSLIFAVLALVFSANTRPQGRETAWGSTEIAALASRAFHDHVTKGQIADARRIYEQALVLARAGHFRRAESRLLASLANCDLAEQRYAAALERNIEALRLSTATADCEQIALLHEARSSIYLQLFELRAAFGEAAEWEKLRQCLANPANRLIADYEAFWLHSLFEGPQAAMHLALRGIREAENLHNASYISEGWHRLGTEFLRAGDDAQSAAYLSRAYRLRRQSKDPKLFLTSFALAELRLREQDYDSAADLIDEAVGSASGGRLPLYLLLHLRGRIHQARGQAALALSDFESAVEAAAQWRGRGLPVDSLRIGVDAGLHPIYASFIELAVETYHRTGSRRWLDASFRIAEASRARSLFEQQSDQSRFHAAVSPLASEYGSALNRLHAEQAQSLADAGPDTRARLARAAHAVTSIEARVGISLTTNSNSSENFRPFESLSSVQQMLSDSRVLITFDLGEAASYRWTLSGAGLDVKILPPAKILAPRCRAFRDAVEHGDPQAAALGRALYTLLFDGIRAPQRRWILALDGPLFDVPFPALVTSGNDEPPRYLIEDHTLEFVPGAWALQPASIPVSDRFVGFGDPVYNRADRRLAPSGWTRWLPWRDSDNLELPRLPGTRLELDACARAWPGPRTVVTGAGATRDRLIQELAGQAAVIHIAAHFLEPPAGPPEVMIALNLRPSPEGLRPDVLTATDLRVLRIPNSLIVMSGCHSAAGVAVPGAGLLGLSRAFLAAGASGVIGSFWLTPDDTGELFLRFYRHWIAGRGDAPAEALRASQQELLREGGWRSQPRYWAAYQLTSRSSGTP